MLLLEILVNLRCLRLISHFILFGKDSPNKRTRTTRIEHGGLPLRSAFKGTGGIGQKLSLKHLVLGKTVLYVLGNIVDLGVQLEYK